MMRFLILAAPLLAVATPAFAQASPDAGATQAPAAAPVAAPKPKKICRSFQVTGRRIAQSACYTAEQWAEIDKANDEAAKKLVNDVQTQGAKGNLSSGSSGSLSTGSIFGLGQ